MTGENRWPCQHACPRFFPGNFLVSPHSWPLALSAILPGHAPYRRSTAGSNPQRDSMAVGRWRFEEAWGRSPAKPANVWANRGARGLTFNSYTLAIAGTDQGDQNGTGGQAWHRRLRGGKDPRIEICLIAICLSMAGGERTGPRVEVETEGIVRLAPNGPGFPLDAEQVRTNIT
jgi:hypothetical protein